MQDRTVWLVEADRRDPQLIPYDQATPRQHRRIRREPTLSRSSWNGAGGIVKHSKARLRNIAVLSLALSGSRLSRDNHLRSICNPFARLTRPNIAFRCHPWPCMLLNLRSHADSSPT